MNQTKDLSSAMMKYLMLPYKERFLCAGKGGNFGSRFMMQQGVDMLKLQGHDGDLDRILMVGDRFDTDIRGANSIGIRSCLVESGAHKFRDGSGWGVKCDFWCNGVGDLVL